jgi:hypothetical protein
VNDLSSRFDDYYGGSTDQTFTDNEVITATDYNFTYGYDFTENCLLQNCTFYDPTSDEYKEEVITLIWKTDGTVQMYD